MAESVISVKSVSGTFPTVNDVSATDMQILVIQGLENVSCAEMRPRESIATRKRFF